MDYPEPRYPRLKRLKSIEELMPKARVLVSQPGDVPFYSLKPGYGIKSGDKILFVVLSEYDSMVVDAICRAMREKGAHVDVFVLDSTPVAPPEGLGAHEAIAFGTEEGGNNYNYYYTLITDLIGTNTAKALAELEKYNLVISGAAGPLPGVSFQWSRFNFTSVEDFASSLIDFPDDLLKLIDDKVFAQINSCEVLRLTDPEGTDVKWTNYNDGRPFISDHILARPMHIGLGYNGKDDCTGVVAGTLNHMGAFPYCKAYIEGGQVVRLEGGGKYGEVWREKLEKYKNVKLPPLSVSKKGARVSEFEEIQMYEISEPGAFWYVECAIGTVPGFFRLPKEGRFECYANMLRDRRRAGYIHNGFGLPMTGQRELLKAGLPWVHVHIHSMFATLEGSTNKGDRITIVDKGHLMVLDDPEVRLMASKYGNPDELLTETWIPAVPGINVPGDYMKDYGQDPVSWIKRETIEHPIWID